MASLAFSRLESLVDLVPARMSAVVKEARATGPFLRGGRYPSESEEQGLESREVEGVVSGDEKSS